MKAKEIRRRVAEFRYSSVVYAPTRAGLSAAIHDLVPYAKRITIEELQPYEARIVVALPWWAALTFGLLHRRVYRQIAKSFHQLLPVGVKVDLRVL